MGRRKIQIKPIDDERSRNVTFNKRKQGLMKKAMELSILCNCEINLVVFIDDKLYEYTTSDPRVLLEKYCQKSSEPHERYSNEDYWKRFNKVGSPKKGKKGKNDSGSDEDDDDLSPVVRPSIESIKRSPPLQSSTTQAAMHPPSHGKIQVTHPANIPSSTGAPYTESQQNAIHPNQSGGVVTMQAMNMNSSHLQSKFHNRIPSSTQGGAPQNNTQNVVRSTIQPSPIPTSLTSSLSENGFDQPSPLTDNLFSSSVFGSGSGFHTPASGRKRGRQGDDAKSNKKKNQGLSISVPNPQNEVAQMDIANFSNGESQTPLLFSDVGISPITPLSSTISATKYDSLEWKDTKDSKDSK